MQNEKAAIKTIIAGGFGLAIRFYEAFALYVDEIAYWNMFGLITLLSMLTSKRLDSDYPLALMRIETMVRACVPEDKHQDTMEA